MISLQLAQTTVDKVWGQARMVTGDSPDAWRRDDYGSLICRSDYGDETACFGWVVDLAPPYGLGPDAPCRLIARHWRHARTLQEKSDEGR